MQDPLLTSAKDLLNGPRVSVGIPCYNRPQGLHAMLECVRHQTYKNLEIIVSDNCSPDEQIPKMMAEFVHADKRIQYFRQEKNVGPTSNFNFVRSKASGEYFVWAADDDAWKETYIEKCLERFQAHPSLVMCYSEAVKSAVGGQPEILLASDIATVGMKRMAGLKKFLKNQHRNIEFYGLMKTHIARRYHFENLFGEDQIFLLFLALHGEVGRTEPGLFINGAGFAGTSVENTVCSGGLQESNIYWGYIFLSMNSMRMILKYDFRLSVIDKVYVILFLIRRVLSPRFRLEIRRGAKKFVRDWLRLRFFDSSSQRRENL